MFHKGLTAKMLNVTKQTASALLFCAYLELGLFIVCVQYLLDVYEDEEEMLVSLEQEDRRSSNFRTRGENYCIGFTITKVSK